MLPPLLANIKLQSASRTQTPCEFTRIRPLRLSKYHAPGRLQNANPCEFTRFRPLRPSKYKAPERLQNANPREFTRIRPKQCCSSVARVKLQSTNIRQFTGIELLRFSANRILEQDTAARAPQEKKSLQSTNPPRVFTGEGVP